MFVYSMRASTVRFFAVVILSLLSLVTLIALVPKLQPVSAAGEAEEIEISYENVRTDADRIAFLAQFGWEVEDAPVAEERVTIPAEFDKVFAAYNELQRTQGLDLSPYSGRVVERYTYTVKNYAGYEGGVQATLLVLRGRVIGGDICAVESNGFLHGFARPA